MDKYQKVAKAREVIPMSENEIRITSQGIFRNYLNYATIVLRDRAGKEIVLKAMGQAINKAVAIAEILKRTIPNLHQDTAISSISMTETWEPIEEGLVPVEMTRYVSMISITLSTRQLNESSPGYQAPLFVENQMPQYYYQQELWDPRGQYNNTFNNYDSYDRGSGRDSRGYYQDGYYQNGNYQDGYYLSGNYQGGYYQNGNYYQGGNYQNGNYQGGNYQSRNYQGGNDQNGNDQNPNYQDNEYYPKWNRGGGQGRGCGNDGNYQGGNDQNRNYQNGNYQGGNNQNRNFQDHEFYPKWNRGGGRGRGSSNDGNYQGVGNFGGRGGEGRGNERGDRGRTGVRGRG